ncbi:cadherin-related family member 5-like isoform X1 [Seriola lalandi dorsalis]|uniref:Cadherin-related family member 5b n=1 Tax=Seriola lalandi dorsalis TaxID=1841481 RepID=A0A3B4Y8I5_SERLL|nr:cadherin-related family member 5-like isoform X1 [Seriola lalandi dorsalis]
MDGLHPHFTVRTSLSFLLLILLQTSTEAVEPICSGPQSVEFPENNTVGAVVANIIVKPGVTLEFSPSSDEPNPFELQGNQLIAAAVLDYETEKNHIARITCTETATNLKLNFVIVVILINENDNKPVFDQNPYHIDVYEMSPVGKTVGRFVATDLDQPNQLYYTLTPESGFELKSPTNPDLLVKTPLAYEKVKNVRLVLTAQDTPLATTDARPSFTATTTIMVTILDKDNRPPWFQPCIMHEMGGAVICQSTGYTGKVVLNEQETGLLPLQPGPLYAIDGDSAINEAITYSFLSGNDELLFEINPNTGNISMLKPASKLETISLTVLAAQKTNSYQFTTTTVSISVQKKSLHLPQFQRPSYRGIITGVGSMAMDPENKDAPLQIIATDDDYTTTDGLNPYITYSTIGNNDFSIVNGHLFMTKDLPEGTLSLQVMAKDTSNDESATAQLSVMVTSGFTTTSLPLSTTDIMTSTSIGESTTNSETTEDIVSTTNPTMSTDNSVSTTIPSTTSESITSTTDSTMSTEGSVSTTNPSMTTEGSSSAHPPTVIIPSGGYGPVDMAALGATLGVLLLICLVVIGVLVHRLRKGKADWRKIYETNVFRSSLVKGSGSPKEGIQYTNEAFENDEDGGSMGSGGPDGGIIMAGREPQKAVESIPHKEAIMKSLAPLHAFLSDDTSMAGSDKADNEKDVKPILTKERRMEEGYKSVWFKEDIDPNAMDEVVIIPDSREDDSEDEDDESSSEPSKPPKVVFADSDLDSGLGVKLEESDGYDALTTDL